MSNSYKILRCEREIRRSPTLSHLRGHTTCDRLPTDCKTLPVVSSSAIREMESCQNSSNCASRFIVLRSCARIVTHSIGDTRSRHVRLWQATQHVVLGEPRSAATRDSRECTCACACASSATARAYTIPACAGRTSQKNALEGVRARHGYYYGYYNIHCNTRSVCMLPPPTLSAY